MLKYQGRLCVSIDGLRDKIFEEAHRFTVFYSSWRNQIYHDLQETYWWNIMKKDIAGFVAKCLDCQQVKAEHLKPGGLPQDIDIRT